MILRISSMESNNIWLVRHVDNPESLQSYEMDDQEEIYTWQIKLINLDKNIKEIASFFQDIYNPNNDDMKSRGSFQIQNILNKVENIKPLIYASPFPSTIQTAIPIAIALKTKIRLELGLFDQTYGFPTTRQIKEYVYGEDLENFIDWHYSTPDYIIKARRELQLQTSRIKKAYLKLLFNKFIESMGTYFRMQQAQEKRDIIVVTYQDDIYEIGNSLVKNTELNIEEYVVISPEVQTTSLESITSEKLITYEKGTVLEIIKVVTNFKENRIRGQIKDSLNWVSIKNLENGYFWMMPTTKPWIKESDIRYGSVCHFRKEDTNKYKFQKCIMNFDGSTEKKYVKTKSKLDILDWVESMEGNVFNESNQHTNEEETNIKSCQEKFEEIYWSHNDIPSQSESLKNYLEKLCKKYFCCSTKN